MLYLYTGATGDGKTLNCLDDVIQAQVLAEKETGSRPTVFYCNFQHFTIKDLEKKRCSKSALGLAFDPEHPYFDLVSDWVECSISDIENIQPLYSDEHPFLKHESIIIIDECQDIYRTRIKGAVPPHITFFEKHRHTGCDFYSITQATRQVDVAFRDLVNEHRSIKRILGRNSVRIKTLNKTIEDKNKDSFPEIVTKTKKYPSHYFGLYRSTSKVTHKKKLPKSLVFGIPFILFFIIVMAYFLISTLTSISDESGDSEVLTVSSREEKNKSSSNPISELFPVGFDFSNRLFLVSEVSTSSFILAKFELLQGEEPDLDSPFVSLTNKDLILFGLDVLRVRSDLYVVDGQWVGTRPFPSYSPDFVCCDDQGARKKRKQKETSIF